MQARNPELLKWAGLLLMVGDHINKYLFNGTLPFLFEAGRVALPLFVFALTANLARASQAGEGAFYRTVGRLVLFGLVSSPVFVALGGLGGGYFPLNILFTLSVITAACAILANESRLPRLVILLAFICGGAWAAGPFLEYGPFAVFLGVTMFMYFRTGGNVWLIFGLLATISLHCINGNFWALAAIPLAAVLNSITFKPCRAKWFFYAFYPAHLCLIWLARIPMSKAGYLFFT